jgi:hypothetical protein
MAPPMNTISKYLLTFVLIAIAAPALSCLSLSAAPTSSSPISSATDRKTIATIQSKNVALPTLSPDGKYLAYVEILPKSKSAVHILNLATQEDFILISSQKIAKYSAGEWKSSVYGMAWLESNRLSIDISDGDVDGAILTYNPLTKKLISEEATEPGYDPEGDKLVKKIADNFPDLQDTNVSLSVKNQTRLSSPEELVVAGELKAGVPNVWLLNFSDRSVKQLFESTDPLAKASIESAKIASDGSLLLLLKPDNGPMVLMTCKNGKITKLQPLKNIKGSAYILYGNGRQTMIIQYVHGAYQQGNNPLFIVNDDQIRESKEFRQLSDVSVSSNGDRIAYSFWKKGKKQIVVKSLR